MRVVFDEGASRECTDRSLPIIDARANIGSQHHVGANLEALADAKISIPDSRGIVGRNRNSVPIAGVAADIGASTIQIDVREEAAGAIAHIRARNGDARQPTFFSIQGGAPWERRVRQNVGTRSRLVKLSVIPIGSGEIHTDLAVGPNDVVSAARRRGSLEDRSFCRHVGAVSRAYSASYNRQRGDKLHMFHMFKSSFP